jgi:hypothetical protein
MEVFILQHFMKDDLLVGQNGGREAHTAGSLTTLLL